VSNWFEFDESASVWGDVADDYRPPPWRIVAVPEVLTWLSDEERSEDQRFRDSLTDALLLLRREGPALGRPWVDQIKGSKLSHPKELRLRSSKRGAYRILFAFDPRRSAVLLVVGDKSTAWNAWYPRAIKLAEARYADYLRRWSQAG
jgi:hypothetical protein